MSRGLWLVLCLALVAASGCDDGGGGDPSVDTGPEIDATGEPEPDAAEPDAAEPEPDAAEPESDAAEPEPDMGEPEPDMGEPEPDMAMPCAEGETRACTVEGVEACAGVQTCVDGAFGPCEPPPEVCDGQDNDCDGTVDNVEGAGDPCSVGVGACAVDGAIACDDAGELSCDAVAGEPADEVCDSGADEDCDGETDEGDCREACADDDDCPAGALCIDEVCVPGDCREDGECAEGELCIDNGCRPGNCRVDDDCADGGICVDFGCRPLPDACRDAQRVDGAGAFEGSTAEAPSQVGASCGGQARSPERAFLVDLGLDGPICLSTVGSAYDTVLHVQTRCGDETTEVACNDDVIPGNLRSQVQLESGAEPIYVFVDGFAGDNSGDFVFTVSEGDCPCVADGQCGEDEVCRAGACAPVVCGDGAREGFEECDDGGIDPGDGCDDACFVEPGFVCQPGDDGVDRCRPEVCESDDDCFGGEICDGGACVVGDCRDDGECGEGELCLDNACTPGDCREDADCGAGQICDGNLCTDAPDEGALRLADGDDAHIGRVEIFVDGAWGTVCDDAFDVRDADVVCRQLGFAGAVRSISTFGGGEDPIWLDQVECAGDEARLLDCPANALGDNDCGHFEDVGVECLRPCEGDGDCFDGESCAEGACRVPADEICDNGIDDDLDGATDCEDDGCFDDDACPCPRDDIFEDASDDLPGPPLPPVRIEDLALCDTDIYSFDLCVGGTAVVTVEFEHAAGNIDVQLGNGTIEEIVAEGVSETDDEVVEYTNDTGLPARMDIFLDYGATGSAYALDIQVFDCEPGAEICANAADDDGDGLVDCEDPDCIEHPACQGQGGGCEAPIPLPGVGAYVGDTTGGPSTSQETDPDCIGSPTPAGSAEAVYAFSPEADGTFCLSTLGSTFDTVLYVRADVCDDPAAEVACNDDNGPIAGGTRSALTLDVVAGSTYFVFVDGFGFNNDGPYELRVTEGPCIVPVEICDNGVNDDVDPRVDCDDPDCFGSEACLDLNCGNGIVDLGEGCDDGDRDPDDGCGADCLVEPGYACDEPAPDEPSECRALAQCGDGAIEAPETCDDGNGDNGDGCDALCTDELYVALRGVEQFVVAFPEGAADTVRFTADVDETRVVARTGDGAGGCVGDTVLDLFPIDAEGNRGERLASNDDGGGNGLCSLIDTRVGPGVYEVDMRGFEGGSLVDVVVDLRVAGVISDQADGEYPGDVPEEGDDLFELVLDRPATVTFDTGGDFVNGGPLGCPGDTVMTLYGFDADGVRRERAFSDDVEPSVCARITADLEPGRYEVEVAHFERLAVRYRLAVELLFPACGNEEIEFGEQCDDGNGEGGDGCDALCTFEVFDALRGVERFTVDIPQNAVDTVRFTVDHDPSRLVAETGDGDGGCPGDTVIDVFPIGPDGERGLAVASDDDGGIGTCSRVDAALPPGDYELEIRGFNGAERRRVVVDHRLEVDISAGGAYDGAVPVAGDDLFVFTLEEPATVTLRTGDGEGGCPGDSRITLYAFDDGDRFAFADNDDDPELGVCSRLVVDLEPGAYEVVVDEFGRDAALGYVLTVEGIGAPQVEVVDVGIINFTFDPDPLVIPVGTTVRWTNLDDAVHTVTSGVPGDALAGAIFDSGNLARGDSFDYTFRSVGEFTYFCRPHSGFMRDYTVIVDGGEDPALAACEESCADVDACFGAAAPDCVEGCMANAENQAAGRCIAEGLDPDAGQCDIAVIGACAGR